ncbi:MAG: TIGR04282 family arsenosugar biosynthesis glycosyltransferase [Planctomycetaceae bacterium]
MPGLLGMFVKQPVPGKVKTRLGADIGNDTSAELYSAFVRDLVDRYAHVGRRRVLAYSPAAAEEWARETVGAQFEIWSQPDADLGSRIQDFFDHAFSLGVRRVVLVGSDSPNLPASYVEQAFELLDEMDVVVGPASDGGFYLIGQREESRNLFAHIEWSSPRVFEQTLRSARQLSAKVALLPVWYDIDTIDDARMMWSHLQAATDAGDECLCPHSLAVLNRMFS